MPKLGFREMLTARQQAVNSLLCVGLDPLPGKVPSHIDLGNIGDEFRAWMCAIVDATAPYACMFKPQSAHWEAIPGGRVALQQTIAHIHTQYPEIPVFLDVKRGDIGRTQQRYREAHLELDGADGINYNAYMGRDCLTNLINTSHMGRALVGLGRTSNPAAWQIQDSPMADGRMLWEHVSRCILRWSNETGVIKDAGLVMGAAHKDPDNPNKIYSWHLSRARQITGDGLWYLIPGIGTQGGFVEETIETSLQGPGSIAINSSSGINFASIGRDFADAAGDKAAGLRDQIRAASGSV